MKITCDSHPGSSEEKRLEGLNLLAPAPAKSDHKRGIFPLAEFPDGVAAFRRGICLLGCAVGLALTATATVTMPYLTDFDPRFGFTPNPLDGQRGWIVFNGSADITTTPIPYLGTQSVVLNPGSPATLIGVPFAAPSPAHPVVYADCLIKPAVGAYLSSFIYLDTSLAALVRNGTQGQIY